MQKLLSYVILLVIPFAFSQMHGTDNTKVDLVIFTYNRPMQLYACLESIDKYMGGVGEIHVIARASNLCFRNAYKIVLEKFPKTLWHWQGNNPHEDFKPYVLRATCNCFSSSYIAFVVDDIIVTDFVNLQDCAKALERYNAYGFFLRLGKNVHTSILSDNFLIPLPQNKLFDEQLFRWNLKDGKDAYWNYPNNVDFTIYRKRHLLRPFIDESYINPNELEEKWAAKYPPQLDVGLCFNHSKTINLPLNIVNTTHPNAHGNVYTSYNLLEQFEAGLKIDIQPFYKINNRFPHEEIPLYFTRRDP